MTPRKTYGMGASALVMALLLVVTALAATAGAQTDRRGRDRVPRNPRPPVTAPAPQPEPAPEPAPAPAPAPSDTVDAEFVSMMIPHHHQARLMSRLARTRSSDPQVRALASRIDVEQGLEISMMQGWQGWNGLQVTNAAQAYEMMLTPMHREHLEHMGMATPEEMAALSAASGKAFDRLYLELMIDHHNGALRMLEDVIINGSDQTLAFWATDMLSAQSSQIWQMRQMLDDLS